MKQNLPFLLLSGLALNSVAFGQTAPNADVKPFYGFASSWTVLPTDLLEYRDPGTRVEIGASFDRSKLRVRDPNETVKDTVRADSYRVAPMASFDKNLFTMSLEAQATFVKNERELFVPGVDETLYTTNRRFFGNPQFAFNINDTVGLGAGFEYFREVYNDEGTKDAAFGRPHASIRLQLGQFKTDIGYKNGVQQKADAAHEYRYLPNETIGKVGYGVSTNWDVGFMVRFLDYNRKSDEMNTLRNVKLSDIDRLGIALESSYRPYDNYSMQLIVRHTPAVDYTLPTMGDVSTDGGQFNSIFHVSDNNDLGIQLGYDGGHSIQKVDAYDTGVHRKVTSDTFHVGASLASKF